VVAWRMNSPRAFVIHGLLIALLAAALVGLGVPAGAEDLSICPPSAEAPTPEAVQAAMKTARDRGFLWRIRKGGRTSYLYGTLHVAKMDWMYPGPTVVNAVRTSDVVAVELDMLDPLVMEQLQAGMMPRPGEVLPAPLTNRLRAQVTAACLPEELMSRLSPEILAVSLVTMSARHRGLDPSYAIDLVLVGMGHGLKKEVSSLETPESQLQLLRGRTPQETETMVDQALAELETDKAGVLVARLAQVWADGRFKELERYEQWCDCIHTEEDRALNKRMLDDRNPVLADRIDAMHAAGKQLFAAVGSLHMIGKVGLPVLMAKRGYAVERVEFKE
jgi:uncharacterized protein YbaP (TraB family)